MSESVGVPQIPPFVSRLTGAKSESERPREGKTEGGVRDRLNNNASRSLGGGDGDRSTRGGREGCEAGVTRENTTILNTNRNWGQFTSSSDSKSQSPGICKIGNTRSRRRAQERVQGSAKKAGAGHSKISCGEISNNKVTYIPSPSRDSLGNSMHLDLCSPHNTNTTVSLHTSNINITAAEALKHSQVAKASRDEGVSSPRRGADSKVV